MKASHAFWAAIFVLPFAFVAVSALADDQKVTEGRLDAVDREGRKRGQTASDASEPVSERTVLAAIVWLAKQQKPDGTWPTDADVSKDSTIKKAIHAHDSTALAILCYLGTGVTHNNNNSHFSSSAAKGVAALVKYADTPDAQRRGRQSAIVATAICEAYEMSQDAALKPIAQKAINAIIAAQDGITGGWSDEPGEPTTLSSSLWPMLALRSAKLAKLNVPSKTIEKAGKFLDSLQSDDGAKYGETKPADVSDLSIAMGLLARYSLFPDWATANEKTMKRGLNVLSKTGPSRNDVTFNFYGTMLLHNWSNAEWDAWNRKIRRLNIESQDRSDTAAMGSWWNKNEVHTAMGGRLYQTELNTLSQEVYYRYLPIFR
jgi:hypothetical protein